MPRQKSEPPRRTPYGTKRTPKPQPGTYEVNATTRNVYSGTVADHHTVVQHANDADDAWVQAQETFKFSKAMAIVKFSVVFIGFVLFAYVALNPYVLSNLFGG